MTGFENIPTISNRRGTSMALTPPPPNVSESVGVRLPVKTVNNVVFLKPPRCDPFVVQDEPARMTQGRVQRCVSYMESNAWSD